MSPARRGPARGRDAHTDPARTGTRVRVALRVPCGNVTYEERVTGAPRDWPKGVPSDPIDDRRQVSEPVPEPTDAGRDRAADALPELLELVDRSTAPRTVVETALPPGAAVAQHDHTRFDETLAGLAGTLDVWPGALRTTLEAGEAITVPRRTAHRYAAGPAGAVPRVTYTPCPPDLERAVAIVRGLQRDGAYPRLGAANQHALLVLAVPTELTDAHPADATGAALDTLRREHGAALAAVRRTLPATYAPAWFASG